MMRAILFALFVTFSVYGSFQIADYDNIVITTDLEPDDVLALKIIFDEANRLHAAAPHKKYPIQLIIVGEGNSAIKKARMETLLSCHFDVPKSVKIEVKEGKSNLDNLFPTDGEELFSKEKLQEYPFPEKEEGSDALIKFVRESERPLIIQLKPVQEIIPLTFHKDLSQKAVVIFYGSFNFRKALDDDEVSRYLGEQALPLKLQMMLDQFGHFFKKVGIIETFGVLGDQSCVYFHYPWSWPIAELIQCSNDPFYSMLKTLIGNWNSYKLDAQLKEIPKLMEKLMVLFPQKQKALSVLCCQFKHLASEWDENRFIALFDQTKCLILELRALNGAHDLILDLLGRVLNLANLVRPGTGIQFTLSDVIVALAVIDSNFFTATPVKVVIKENGFLHTAPDPNSTIFYFDRKDPKQFVDLLMPRLAK